MSITFEYCRVTTVRFAHGFALVECDSSNNNYYNDILFINNYGCSQI